MAVERLTAEAKLAEGANVSSSSLALVRRDIPFPDDLKGKRVLEIGAGTSSTTKELSYRGAFTVAIDYKYDDMKCLKAFAAEDIRKWETDPRLRKQQKEDRKMIRDLKYNPFDRLETINGILSERSRALASFLKDIKERKGNYIAAIAGNLPFQDNVFDFCFSYNGITAFPIQNEDVVLNSVREALRVLKPRGTLALSLWFSPEWDQRPINKVNGTILLRFLEKGGIPFEEHHMEFNKALIVTKP